MTDFSLTDIDVISTQMQTIIIYLKNIKMYQNTLNNFGDETGEIRA